MGEGSPQLTELVPGEAYLIFEVADIMRSAGAPIPEIREQLVAAWRRDRGMAAAGQAAQRVLERVEGGMSFADALAEEDVDLPSPRELNLNRRELAEQGDVTRATILFFSMAEDTAKRVAVPDASRWFVVELDEIDTPDLAIDSEEVANLSQQLSQVLGDEYVAQFVRGAESTLEVDRNDDGIDAVRRQLTGAASN